MKKAFVVFIVCCMLCVGMSGIVASVTASPFSRDTNNDVFDSYPDATKTKTSTMEIIENTVYKYMNMDEKMYEAPEKQVGKTIDIPWIGSTGDFLEWYIRIKYNGEDFEQELDISIFDFREKFLKHPEYAEILLFDVDDDPEDDVEVRVGFYWAKIRHPDGSYPTSLEFRFRIRTSGLPNGGAIEDRTAEIEVWSELHVNYGLVKDGSNSNSQSSGNYNQFPGQNQVAQQSQMCSWQSQVMGQTLGLGETTGFAPLQSQLNNMLSGSLQENVENEPLENPQPLASDDDHFSIGSGYRSPAGEEIPTLSEKRFAFAKAKLFSPTIFKHIMDPGVDEPIEFLYGFRSFKAGHSTPEYDIEFSVEFDPAVYLITKFIPLGGYVYYYFDQYSQENSEVRVTFSSNILKGSGEGVTLTLIFDEIDENLGQAGRWMSFDLNLKGFEYKASHRFNVGIIVSSPVFEEKVQINGIPKEVDFGWGVDVDFIIVQDELVYVDVDGYVELDMSSKLDEIIVYYPKSDPDALDVTFVKFCDIPSSQKLSAGASLNIDNGSMLKIDVDGYVRLDMNSRPGEIAVFYPKPDPEDPDIVFINVPPGSLPRSGTLSAEATLYIDIDDFSNPNNYIYAKAQRTASSNFNEINFYLPNVETPIVQVTDIPANTYARGKFYWNKLEGHARAQRSSAGAPDPVHINLEFDTITLSDVLTIGDGHIQLDFKIAEQGYFNFDTSNEMIGNTFQVSNSATGNSLTISAETVSADDFEAEWDLDTSGEQIKINDLYLSGSLTSFKNFNVDIELDWNNVDFDGNWVSGEEGGFSIDLYQEESTTINFDLDDVIEDLDINGYVILSEHIHFDMSWKWKQGQSYQDPGFFTINNEINDANVQEIWLYVTYKDKFGADVKILDASLYFKLKWYKHPQMWLPVFWLEYNLGFNIDYVKLLWEGTWHDVYP